MTLDADVVTDVGHAYCYDLIAQTREGYLATYVRRAFGKAGESSATAGDRSTSQGDRGNFEGDRGNFEGDRSNFEGDRSNSRGDAEKNERAPDDSVGVTTKS